MKSYFVSYVILNPFGYGNMYITAPTDTPLSRSVIEKQQAELSEKYGPVIFLNIVPLDVAEDRP